MRIEIEPGVRLFVDIEGLGRAPEGPELREKPTPEILFAHTRTELCGMDLRPGLSAVQCPVLVLAGEDDPVTPPQDAEEIVAALPAAWVQFERFAGVGHGVWRDDPEAAERVLRVFLRPVRA